MSPASQGSLEVERYIGSNLISSCARVNNFRSNGKGRKPTEGKVVLQRTNVNSGDGYNRHGGNRQGYPMANMLSPCNCRGGNLNVGPRPGQFAAAGWTGLPLISVAGDGKKKNQYQDRPRNLTATEDESNLRSPLSRLAIHTQGAPLILSGRCYNGRKNQNRGNQVRNVRGDLVIRRSNKYKDNHGGTSDCLSVASDESSGSGHSENCLPRIIKPRKRRKKDRKPSIPSSTENFPSEETDGKEKEKEPDEAKGETEVGDSGQSPEKCDTKPNSAVVTSPSISNGSQEEASEDDESSHGPKLHHTFEDVTESETPSYAVCTPSSCQCHYCDPSGIWDAPSNFFSNRNSSPFLSPPANANKSFHYFSHSDLVLRRSWSEPMPETPQQQQQQNHQQQRENENNSQGKNFRLLYGLPIRSNSFTETNSNWSTDGSMKRWDAILKGDNTSAGDENGDECNKKVAGGEKVNFSYGSQCLEVSTEIVTSPNGHRDIEIRFYSTSPPSS